MFKIQIQKDIQQGYAHPMTIRHRFDWIVRRDTGYSNSYPKTTAL